MIKWYFFNLAWSYSIKTIDSNNYKTITNKILVDDDILT
jgi:hypothetical protein